MKIKAIAALCKKRKAIYLYNAPNGIQWLGDGHAMYPLRNMPHLSLDNVFTMFDIPESKQEKYSIPDNLRYDEICFEDAAPVENIAEQGKLSIVIEDCTLIPLETSQGLVFIDKNYLNPVSDMDMDMVEMYERFDDGGHTGIAVKCGMMIVGIIMPYNIIKQEFVELLETLTQRCAVALQNKTGRYEAQN